MLVRIAPELEATGAIRFSMEPSAGLRTMSTSDQEMSMNPFKFNGTTERLLSHTIQRDDENSPYAYTE